MSFELVQPVCKAFDESALGGERRLRGCFLGG